MQPCDFEVSRKSPLAGLVRLAIISVFITFGAYGSPAYSMPQLQIEPRMAVLDRPGETVALRAQWADPAQAILGTIVWHSSDPSEVSVSATGVATALVPDAFALITASVNTSIPHGVGSASVMIAELQPDLIQLPESYLIHAGRPALIGAANSLDLELVVSSNRATQGLRVGDKVTFGYQAGLEIESRSVGFGQIVLRGPILTLPQFYRRLNASLDSNSLSSVSSLMTRAAAGKAGSGGGVSGAGGGGGGGGGAGICGRCDCALTPAFSVDSFLKVEIDDTGFKKFTFTLDGLASIDSGGVSISATLSCEYKLPKIPVFPPVQLGVLALLPQIEIAYGLDFGVTAGAEFPITEVDLGVPFNFALLMTPTTHSVPWDIGSPLSSFGDTAFNAVSSSVTASGEASMEFGLELGLFPAFLYTDEVALLQIDLMVNRFALGRTFTWPSEAFYGPEDPRYKGPSISDGLSWKLIPLRVLPGQFTEDLFKLLGRPSFELSAPAIDVASAPLLTDTTPELVVTNSSVTIGGGLFPESTRATVERDPWPLPFGSEWIDSDSVWLSKDGGDYVDQGADDLDWTPEEGDEGDWKVRGMSTHRFLPDYPIATEAQDVKVYGLDFIGVAPRPLVFDTSLGATDEETLLLISRGEEAIPYEIVIPASEAGWLSVTAGGTGTVGIDQTEPVTLTATCGPDTPGEHGLIQVRHTGTGAMVNAEVALRCVPYTITEQVELRGAVGETASGLIRIDNSDGDQGFDFTVDRGDFPGSITPVAASVIAHGTKPIALSTSCGEEPSSTSFKSRVDVEIGAVTIRHPVLILVSCVKPPEDDDPGTTWGDPHLKSLDGYRFDFHALGQFVLSRGDLAGGASFEVQTRQEKHPYNPVAFNRGVAAEIQTGSGTTDQVLFSHHELFINGALTELENGMSVTLASGATLKRSGRRFHLLFPDGETRLSVKRGSSGLEMLDVELSLGSSASSVEGLLGDFDGDNGNDLQTRTGTVLDETTISFADFYDHFAYDAVTGWVIRNASESLFYPVDGVNPASLIDTAFPGAPVDLSAIDPDLLEWAEEVCDALPLDVPILEDACVVDVAMTGDADAGLAAFEASSGYSVGRLLFAEDFEVIPPGGTTSWVYGDWVELPDGRRLIEPNFGNVGLNLYWIDTAPMMRVSFDVVLYGDYPDPKLFRIADLSSDEEFRTSFTTVTGNLQHFPDSYTGSPFTPAQPALTGVVEAIPASGTEPAVSVFRVHLDFPETHVNPHVYLSRLSAGDGWYLDNFEIRELESH